MQRITQMTTQLCYKIAISFHLGSELRSPFVIPFSLFQSHTHSHTHSLSPSLSLSLWHTHTIFTFFFKPFFSLCFSFSSTPVGIVERLCLKFGCINTCFYSASATLAFQLCLHNLACLITTESKAMVYTKVNWLWKVNLFDVVNVATLTCEYKQCFVGVIKLWLMDQLWKCETVH